MLQDVNSIFSGAIAADGSRTAQAVTATALSTNVIDLRNSGLLALKNEGIVGQNVYLNVDVIAAFNTLTSLTITLETDSTSNLATSPTVHLTFSVLLAALAAGTKVVQVALPILPNYERYMGVRYTVVGSNPTLGTVMAYLSLDPQSNTGYPSGYTLDV